MSSDTPLVDPKFLVEAVRQYTKLPVFSAIARVFVTGEYKNETGIFGAGIRELTPPIKHGLWEMHAATLLWIPAHRMIGDTCNGWQLEDLLMEKNPAREFVDLNSKEGRKVLKRESSDD